MKLMKNFEDISKPKMTEEERQKAYNEYICKDFERIKKRNTQTEQLIKERGSGLITGTDLIERGTIIENEYREYEKKKKDYAPKLKTSSQPVELNKPYKPKPQTRAQIHEGPQPLPNYQRPNVPLLEDDRRKCMSACGYDNVDYRKRLHLEAFSSILL